MVGGMGRRLRIDVAGEFLGNIFPDDPNRFAGLTSITLGISTRGTEQPGTVVDRLLTTLGVTQHSEVAKVDRDRMERVSAEDEEMILLILDLMD